nr:hypothetical protein [Tanacetum cinerariifolium]
SAQRLRIGRSNFRLPSDIQSKESTLQVVYDVLRRSPFFKAFLVIADASEIYMQEFWATAKVYQHSIRFKMDTRKHIVDLEAFREMLHISPRALGQSFAELPFEEEILEFLWFLGHKHKNQKKSNEMYYPRFTKVIIHYFMTKKPSIPRRNKVNWHYVRDDILFSTIKVAYKEYYACATGEAAPKPKASARKKKGGSTSSTTPPTPIATPTPTTTVVAAPRISAAAKEEEADELYRDVNINQGRGLQVSQDIEDSHVTLTLTHSDGQQESSSTSSFVTNLLNPIIDPCMESIFSTGSSFVTPIPSPKFTMTPSIITTTTTASQPPIPPTPIPSDVQVSQDIEDSHVTLTPTHSDGQQESSSTSSFVTNLLNPIIDPCMESIFLTGSSFVTPIPSPKFTMTPSIITTTTTASQPPIPPTPIPSDVLQTLLTFASKIIKKQVKSQVKVQVTRILPKIEEFMNTQLEAEVLTRSSHSSRTSYAVAADLSEMELKKILIDQMEGNKSIQRSDKQRNLYKALVEAYEADKTILDSYGESAILKRRRKDDDDQEGPSARSDRGSTTGTQSRQMSASESAFAEEPVQTTCQMEEPSHPVFETGAEDQPIIQTSQHREWFSQPRKPPTPDRDWNKTLPAIQGSAQSWISEPAKQTDARSSFNELLDTPVDFSNFIMNQLGVNTLTPKLLAGPTYELMRGSCNSLTEL